PDQFAQQYPGARPAVVETVTETYTTTYISASDAVTALQSSLAGAKINYAVGPNQIVPAGMGSGGYSGTPGSSGAGGAGGSGLGGGAATGGSGGAAKPGATGGAGAVGNSGGSSRTIILSGERDSVEQALSILRTLDVARPQVHIDVRMDDVSNNALKD